MNQNENPKTNQNRDPNQISPPRPSRLARIVLVMSGEELAGRSTDPRELDADKTVIPVYTPYTSEVWIDAERVTLYKCVDQKEGMKQVHSFESAELSMISRVWQQLFMFNEPLYRGSFNPADGE